MYMARGRSCKDLLVARDSICRTRLGDVPSFKLRQRLEIPQGSRLPPALHSKLPIHYPAELFAVLDLQTQTLSETYQLDLKALLRGSARPEPGQTAPVAT
jgi:hypothetical protein